MPATAAAPITPHLGIAKMFNTMLSTDPRNTTFRTSLNRSAESNK